MRLDTQLNVPQVCEYVNLCDHCHSAGIHDEHQMLKIEHPDDAVAIRAAVRTTLFLAPQCLNSSCPSANPLQPYEDDTDSVLLGFRVYSKSYAPVSISGQLANGYTIRWKKVD
jgi:hypothetical protein